MWFKEGQYVYLSNLFVRLFLHHFHNVLNILSNTLFDFASFISLRFILVY